MFFPRLQLLVLLALVAAVPEALVRSPDDQLAFQAMLVVQLLGVIVAAIAVAAVFSALGLAVVRTATWPVRHNASTFVAWSFLRAPRGQSPLPMRLWRFVLTQVGASHGAVPAISWRNGLIGLLFCGSGTLLLLQWAADATIGALVGRNCGAMLALHGLLLVIGALPWRALRAAVAVILLVAAAAAASLAAAVPVVVARVSPPALVAGVLIALVAGFAWSGGETGLARRLTWRGVWVAAIGAVGLTLALLWLQSGGPQATIVVLVSAAAAVLAVGGYLLLQRQAKVSLPVFVAIVGVAAGTWALIVVLSVMGGFAADLRSKMLIANAHALAETPGRGTGFAGAAKLAHTLRQVAGVASVSPQVRGDAILSSSFNVHNFVGIRGIDVLLPDVAQDFAATMRTGSLALLRDPTGLGNDRALTRRPLNLPRDVPEAPGSSAAPAMPLSVAPTRAQSSDDAVLRAMGQIAPGPAEPLAPQPKMPNMLLLPSDGGKVHGGGNAAEVLPDEPLSPDRPVPVIEKRSGSNALKGLLGMTDDPPAAAPEAVDVPVPPGLVVGVELARTLQVELGDKIEVVTPDSDVGPTGMRPRVRTFRLAGTFETGLYEADSKVAYMAIDEAARYFNLQGDANVLELRLMEPEAPDAVLAEVRTTLQHAGAKNLELVDWRQLNRSLFSALAFERLVIFLVLGLIILVAAFAIVSALTMVILQKHDSIAMLRAMGAHAGAMRSAFVQMGAVIGLIGTTAGLLLGIGTCLLVETLGIALPEAYYVRTLPVRLHGGEVLAVIGASIAISLIATVFPARSAARLHPLEGLRHG